MKTIFYLFVAVALVACTSQNSVPNVQVTQISDDRHIIVRADSLFDKISIIEVPLRFNLASKSLKKRKLDYTKFYFCTDLIEDLKDHTPSGWNTDVLNCGVDYDIFRDSYRDMPVVSLFDHPDIPLYTRHVVYRSPILQDSLKFYLDVMRAADLRSMEVGTLEDFKLRHPGLTDMLLKGDSIRFDFTANKDIREYLFSVRLPVEY